VASVDSGDECSGKHVKWILSRPTLLTTSNQTIATSWTGRQDTSVYTEDPSEGGEFPRQPAFCGCAYKLTRHSHWATFWGTGLCLRISVIICVRHCNRVGRYKDVGLCAWLARRYRAKEQGAKAPIENSADECRQDWRVESKKIPFVYGAAVYQLDGMVRFELRRKRYSITRESSIKPNRQAVRVLAIRTFV